MDDVLVRLGVAPLVADVPAELLEEWIYKFTTYLGFVVLPGLVRVAVGIEPLDKLSDTRRQGTHLAEPTN